jgi:hypothetical protein
MTACRRVGISAIVAISAATFEMDCTTAVVIEKNPSRLPAGWPLQGMNGLAQGRMNDA